MKQAITWMRPSGNALVTNDEPATIAHCLAQGYEQIDGPPVVQEDLDFEEDDDEEEDDED